MNFLNGLYFKIHIGKKLKMYFTFLMFQIRKYERLIKDAPIVVFDANLTVEAISTILDLCRKYNKPGEY